MTFTAKVGAYALLNGALLLTAHAQTTIEVPQPVPSHMQELKAIRDRASEDALLKYWLEGLMNGAIKHGLDRAVDRNLRSHDVAQEFYRKTMQDVDEVIYQYRIHQLKTSALAKAGERGQYQDLLKLVQEVAVSLGFPPDAVANTHVYVSGQPVVNAYTYSGTTDVIEVVVYEGLLDLMAKDPGALKQVIGHELGHIKAGHIRNRLLLLAVFNATAEDLIPDPDAKTPPTEIKDPKAAEKKILVEEAIYREAQYLVGIDPLNHSTLRKLLGKASTELLLHADTRTQEHMAQNVLTRVLTISDLIRTRTTRAQRWELSNSLLDTVLNYGQNADKADDKTVKKERREPTFKELKDFMAKLDGILSRAQEISSDRYGLLATKNERDSILAYVRMVGGKNATIEGMLGQQAELDNLLLNNPEAQKEEGTHPSPAERAEQFGEFLRHPGFLIYSQPYLQAIYEYMSLSQLIYQSDQVIGKDIHDLTTIHHARWKREKAIAFAQELSTWIEVRVATEISEAVASQNPTGAEFVQLKGLLDIMETFTSGGRGQLEGRLFQDWVKELGRPNRLVANLLAHIESLKPGYRSNAPAMRVLEKADEALKAAAPGYEGGKKRASQSFVDEVRKPPTGALPPTPGPKPTGTGCETPLV
jgi:Zn-dependent protease with chaperone function